MSELSSISQDNNEINIINNEELIDENNTNENNNFIEENYQLVDKVMNNLTSIAITSIKDQISNIYDKLLHDKDIELKNQKEYYENIILHQKNEINLLTNELNDKQNTLNNTIIYNEHLIDKTSKLFISRINIEKFKNSFTEWKLSTEKSKYTRRINGLSINMNELLLKHRSFISIMKEYHIKNIETVKAKITSQVDNVAKEMIQKYEEEVYILTNKLHLAVVELNHEKYKREQLEEDLRQMILKNMTAMNNEAFQIFENTCSYQKPKIYTENDVNTSTSSLPNPPLNIKPVEISSKPINRNGFGAVNFDNLYINKQANVIRHKPIPRHQLDKQQSAPINLKDS